jgi:hypothetical protein
MTLPRWVADAWAARMQSEACLYVDLAPFDGEPLFEVAFIDAGKMVLAMTPAARAHARIETDESAYPSAEMESMKHEDEGEI